MLAVGSSPARSCSSAWTAAATLLYGLKPYDPVTMLAAMALLTVVALAASYRAGAPAAAVEPMTALRED